MTNSEKIKAYLDAGHKVRVEHNWHISILVWYAYESKSNIIWYTKFKHWDEQIIWSVLGYYDDELWYKDATISIHKEPLRYPKVGDKVIDVKTWVIYVVMKCLDYCCVVCDWLPLAIDYRHLAPYIE